MIIDVFIIGIKCQTQYIFIITPCCSQFRLILIYIIIAINSRLMGINIFWRFSSSRDKLNKIKTNELFAEFFFSIPKKNQTDNCIIFAKQKYSCWLVHICQSAKITRIIKKSPSLNNFKIPPVIKQCK